MKRWNAKSLHASRSASASAEPDAPRSMKPWGMAETVTEGNPRSMFTSFIIGCTLDTLIGHHVYCKVDSLCKLDTIQRLELLKISSTNDGDRTMHTWSWWCSVSMAEDKGHMSSASRISTFSRYSDRLGLRTQLARASQGLHGAAVTSKSPCSLPSEQIAVRPKIVRWTTKPKAEKCWTQTIVGLAALCEMEWTAASC